MEQILGRPLDPSEIRSHEDPVTSLDLATHDILIVGWNLHGDASGLDDAILSAGIAGRVILSGHDADYHTVNGPPAAEVFLVQAIGYVLEGVDLGMGTGMITLGCSGAFPYLPFPYLPEEWGVDASQRDGEYVTEFTSEALASGVYDGLTPSDMSSWQESYHDVFDIGPDSDFVEFELGGYSGDDIITVARLCCGIELTKTDDIDDWDCVEPDDYVNYTISYGPGGCGVCSDVVLIDYLPPEVDFDSCSDDGVYSYTEHTVTWYIDYLEASDYVTLKVKVNELAEPVGVLTNRCDIVVSDTTYKSIEVDTDVCCSAEPVAHWRFDEGSGSSISDVIGDNDGTLVGDPTWVPGYSVQPRDYALDFDGDDYVELSHPVGALTGDSVTISAWVKPASGLSSTYYPIVTQYKNDQGTKAGYYLSLYGYKPDFYLTDGCWIQSSSSIDTDWHWVVGTYDGEYISIYVDGDQESLERPGYTGIYTDAYIGAGGVGDAGRFEGTIDNVWVYVCAWHPQQDCYPMCQWDHSKLLEYHQWVEMGRPDCWCESPIDGTHYQCHGDADGKTELPLKYRIYGGDLNLVVENWKRKIDDPLLNPCADIDHGAELILKYRVYGKDLNTVVTNWKNKDGDLPNNCADCGRWQEDRGGGELSFEELLKWLAEIWLDPEVRNVIDEDVWLKFIESLKQDIEKPVLDSQQ